jgi:hypothetical protein
MARDASFVQRRKARQAMPISRYFTVAGSALLVLLFVADGYFGESASHSRFHGSLYESALYAPRLAEIAVAVDRRPAREATPASRVSEVFAQFAPSEVRRGKRYAAAETFVR